MEDRTPGHLGHINPHPLFSLISNRAESVENQSAHIAEPTNAVDNVDAPSAAIVAPSAPPSRGFPVPSGSPGGLLILAIQDPPGPGGRPSPIVFAPGLPLSVRLEVDANLAWFDRSDARRVRLLGWQRGGGGGGTGGGGGGGREQERVTEEDVREWM